MSFGVLMCNQTALSISKNAAQQCVHPNGGTLRVFRNFAWFQAGSGKVALSCPTHQSQFKKASAYAKAAAKTHPLYAELAARLHKPAYNIALSDSARHGSPCEEGVLSGTNTR